jgi:hypothetical protein
MRVLSHLQAMNCTYFSFATPQILHKIWVTSIATARRETPREAIPNAVGRPNAYISGTKLTNYINTVVSKAVG